MPNSLEVNDELLPDMPKRMPLGRPIRIAPPPRPPRRTGRSARPPIMARQAARALRELLRELVLALQQGGHVARRGDADGHEPVADLAEDDAAVGAALYGRLDGVDLVLEVGVEGIDQDHVRGCGRHQHILGGNVLAHRWPIATSDAVRWTIVAKLELKAFQASCQ
jgi:hypothetical protein